MPISKWERKALVPFGAASQVARELGCSKALVSLVMAGTAGDTPLTQQIRRRLAKKAKVPTAVLFPPELPHKGQGGPAPKCSAPLAA